METIRNFYRKHLHSYIGICIVLAFLLTLIIETLARQTVYGGIVFLFQHPLVFLFNTLIIFVFLSLGLLFRRRMFITVFVSLFWLVLGIINGYILSNRMTPFTTGDLAELKDALTLIQNYLSTGQVILVIVALAGLACAIVILFIKLPRLPEKVTYRRAIPAFLIICAIGAGGTIGAVKAHVVDTYFPNLAYGYRDNGFSYCFLATWLDKGVHRPTGYGQAMMDKIFTDQEQATLRKEQAKLNDQPSLTTDQEHPNIIFLQLESFMDPLTVRGLDLDRDPIPNYRKLMQEYSSGKFQVPSMGAGTANTEFENMTGMSVKFFGPGEYPYKTVLKDTTCESIPYDLRSLGYATHAIHNHRAAFYDRNNVFGNLGFETFTSVEYMSDVSRTPKNWARDNVLTREMTDTMETTDGPDYIYTISVQGHGKYPTEQVIEEPEVTVTNAPTQELKWQWEYYVNQIHEMDQFVKELTEELSTFKEPVVLVMYGDHLPAIDNLTEGNLPGRNIYETDYVIWSNFKMKAIHKKLYAYQMGAELLDRLNIHTGTLVTYHQNHRKDSGYLENLRALQYDMLYGRRYIYHDDGKTPLTALKLQMGVKEIRIERIVEIGGKYYIKGENFTEYSKVNLDGKILKTQYLGPTLLGISEKEEVKPEDAARMKISQVEKNKEILSTTE